MNRPASILMVDDDELLTRVIAEFLKSRGFEVWTAYNGLQGYTCYLSHPTELVVTDIQMPFAGDDLLRLIANGTSANPTNPGVLHRADPRG